MALYTNQQFPPVAADLAAYPNSVGGRIMAAVGGQNMATIAGVTALVAEFQNLGWTWNPNVGGRSAAQGRELLDRQIAAIGNGECGWVAHAMRELLATPAPYGFGIAAAATATYAGNGDGFLSAHAGIVHNLPANTSAGPGCRPCRRPRSGT